MRRRSLLIGLLIMLALVTSGFTYAFWAAGVAGDADTATGTISIGEADEAVTTVTVGNQTSAGQLVPVGRSGDSIGSPVEYVMLQFSVQWTSAAAEATGATGTLAFAESNVLINSSATYAGLVNITHQIGGTVTGGTFNADGSTALTVGDTVSVWVKVTLTEPANETAYNAIAGFDITFTGTFTVTVTP